MCLQRADLVIIVPVNLAECFSQKNTSLPILLVPKSTYKNPGEGRKTKGRQEKGVLSLWKIERVELLLFFFHWLWGGGGEPVESENDQEKYGGREIDNVDLDVLGFSVCVSH